MARKKNSGVSKPRAELLVKLTAAAPALAGNDLIPTLTHFCFSKGEIIAFNDQIAISVPYKMPMLSGGTFQGSTPGATLVAMLKASKARDVSFEVDGDILRVKAASTNLKLPVMPEEDFHAVFTMPKLKNKNKIEVTHWSEFIEALAGCSRSFGIDASVPEQLGVTLIRDGSVLKLFAVNDSTLSHSRVGLKKGAEFDGRVVLSAEFCKQLLALGKEAPEHFEVCEEHAIFVSSSGIRLFGRIIECAHTTDFDKVLAQHMPKNATKNSIAIPSKLKGILERAVIITDTVDHGAVNVKVVEKGESTKISFRAQSARGQVNDYLTTQPGHPEVSCSFEPKLLRAGVLEFESMLFSEHVAVFKKGNSVYLVSAFGE